jgi:hypothetical protein
MLKKYLNWFRTTPDGYLHADAETNWQNYSTIQGPTQQKPVSIASANVVAPVGFLTILTGNTVVKTITPPYPDRVHMLAIQYAGVAGNDATGNITLLMTSIASQIILYVFNPLTAKYTPVQ